MLIVAFYFILRYVLCFPDQTGNFSTGFDKFLSSSTDEFYRYQGSLTTPPCDESVIWTVFENKNTISESQVGLWMFACQE